LEAKLNCDLLQAQTEAIRHKDERARRAGQRIDCVLVLTLSIALSALWLRLEPGLLAAFVAILAITMNGTREVAGQSR